MVFTYRVPADAAPLVGGRVLVPFRQQRMSGIVVEAARPQALRRHKELFSPRSISRRSR